MRSKLFLVILLILSVLSSYSQSYSDLGSWTAVQVNKVFSRSYAMLRGELRTMENLSETECWFMMAGGGYCFTKWLKADLSYEFWKLPSTASNPTVHKGVLSVTGTLKRDALAFMLREKYEFTYNQNSSTITNVLRSRLRAQYKINSSSNVAYTPYLMYEFFNGFEGQGWMRSLHYAGCEFSFGTHHTIDLFYMYHLYGTDIGTAARHIIGLGYNFTF